MVVNRRNCETKFSDVRLINASVRRKLQSEKNSGSDLSDRLALRKVYASGNRIKRHARAGEREISAKSGDPGKEKGRD